MQNIEIKHLKNIQELRELIVVFSRVFESSYDVSDEYLGAMLTNRSLIAIGACSGDTVVGGLIAFEMHPIHGAQEIYVYDIGVDPDYQKQGIGNALMAYLKAEGIKRGAKTIFVEAESEDEGAVAFYRAIGGEEVLVNHFNFTIYP